MTDRELGKQRLQGNSILTPITSFPSPLFLVDFLATFCQQYRAVRAIKYRTQIPIIICGKRTAQRNQGKPGQARQTVFHSTHGTEPPGYQVHRHPNPNEATQRGIQARALQKTNGILALLRKITPLGRQTRRLPRSGAPREQTKRAPIRNSAIPSRTLVAFQPLNRKLVLSFAAAFSCSPHRLPCTRPLS